MRMPTCSGPEVSRALLKYFHNEPQMWLCLYFLLVILIFSLFPSSLLQQTQIHNLDLTKKKKNRLVITDAYLQTSYRTEVWESAWGGLSVKHVASFQPASCWGASTAWDFAHNYSHAFWRKIFSVSPASAFLQDVRGQLLHSFSSRVWFILPSEGQAWNSIALLEVFIGWEIIYSLIFKVNQIAQFNYRNNVAKDAVISVLWLFLSAFSVNTCLSALDKPVIQHFSTQGDGWWGYLWGFVAFSL